MKKYLLLILLFIFPLMVNAGEYKVINHVIDSEIEIAGALSVKEVVVVEGDTKFFTRVLNNESFDGSWDGKSIDLEGSPIYNGQGVDAIKVSAYEVGDEKIDLNNLTPEDIKYLDELNPKKPSDKCYTTTKNEDGTTSVKIFYPVKNKKIAFYFEYKVTNVVIKHNDIKEINYTFKNINLNSEETYVRMIIPYPTNEEDYHVFVHGNQSGEVQELVNSNEQKVGVIAKFTEINEGVNFRMTLPQTQVGIDMYLNNSNIDALEDIIKLENNRLKKTTNSGKIINIMKYALTIIGALYLIGSFIFLKLEHKVLYIIYLVFGLFIMLFNFLFRFNYWYLYLIILMPIIVYLIKRFIISKSK